MWYPRMYFRISSILLGTLLASTMSLSQAETVYVMAGSADEFKTLLLEMNENLEVVNTASLAFTNTGSLLATSPDKQYIYGRGSNGLFAYDTLSKKFIFNNSVRHGFFPDWIFAASPSETTKKEWIHIHNRVSPGLSNERDTLLAVERSFVEGDTTARSIEYKFIDYHFSRQMIEKIVADPTDDQHFFLVLSGYKAVSEKPERHIIEMRFIEDKNGYEIINSVPFNYYYNYLNKVSEMLIRPQGDWLYLQMEDEDFVIMVNTKDLSHQEIFLTEDLYNIALSEDGNTLFASYNSSPRGGLKSFTNIDNREKFTLKEDSPNETYTMDGIEYDYEHENILLNKMNYVPEYFSLSFPIGVGPDHIYESYAKLSTVYSKHGRIDRNKDMTILIDEESDEIQRCLRIDFTCLFDTIAHDYGNKNHLFTAKKFMNPTGESKLIISKTDLKNPEKTQYVLLGTEVGNHTHPASILVIE